MTPDPTEWTKELIEELKDMPIEEGQVWRKLGPFDWLRVEQIHDPDHPGNSYEGGVIGCSVTYFPPQLKGIVLQKGQRFFIPSTKEYTWQERIKDHRFLMKSEDEPHWLAHLM